MPMQKSKRPSNVQSQSIFEVPTIPAMPRSIHSVSDCADCLPCITQPSRTAAFTKAFSLSLLLTRFSQWASQRRQNFAPALWPSETPGHVLTRCLQGRFGRHRDLHGERFGNDGEALGRRLVRFVPIAER